MNLSGSLRSERLRSWPVRSCCGQNWARWLALAWIAAHVVISALNLMQGLLIHCVVFLLIAAILFQREAREYFKTG